MGRSSPFPSDDQPAAARDFRGLVAACSPALLLYARSWVPHAEAEDLLQEAMVQFILAEQGPAQQRPVDPRAWLFRTVRNLALNRHRVHKRRRTRAIGAMDEPALFASTAESLADPNEVRGALLALNESDREVLILRIWAGLTFEQIAELTSVSVTTAFRTHQRALGAMREQLERAARVSTHPAPAAAPSTKGSYP